MSGELENPRAFPRSAYDGRGETDSPFPHHEQDGMTLRDWFAGKALQGILANPASEFDPEGTAKACRAYADAMLAERGKP